MTEASVPPARVIDASVAVKWYLDDEDGVQEARALVEQFERGAIYPIAPDCFFYEVGGVIRTAERRTPPRLDPQRADKIIQAVADLALYSFPSQLLLPDALRLARSLQVSFYDAMYLALAELVGARYMTADRRLHQRIRHLPYVELIGASGSD